MPEFTISDLKRALVEVKRICAKREYCGGCHFEDERSVFCPMQNRPDKWDIDDWKESMKDDTGTAL